MSSKEDKRFFVIGVGNPLRSDDGIGPYIVEIIAGRKIPGVVTICSQQLNLELLEEAVGYSKILIVDAGVQGEGLMFKKIQDSGDGSPPSSHHLTPEFFGAMARQLYERDINLYLCSIRGWNFDVGDTLSAQVVELLPQAISELEAFLKEK